MFSEQLIEGGDAPLNLARADAGAPVLFLHGVGRCWQDFTALAGALACRWQINALDFRGHGGSARTPGKYLVRDYVRDVVAVVKHAIKRPTILYGHSLGAMAAAGAAAEIPELVRGLVLEDPPLDTMSQGIEKTSFFVLFQALRTLSGSSMEVSELSRELAEVRINAPDRPQPVRLGQARDAASLRFMAACLKRVDPTLWDPILDGRWLEGYDIAGVLQAIRCPTLLLQGNVAEGGALGDAAAAEVERLVSDCIRIQVTRAGHLIHNLQHETTLRLVAPFLESIAIGS
jgi:pimeloyl-ACP methyl ester carboxylesterase